MRRGSSLLEHVVCLAAASFTMYLTVLGGLGSFNMLHVHRLAEEGTRWASCRTTTPAAVEAYVRSRAVGLDQSKLDVTVTLVPATTTRVVNRSFEDVAPVQGTVRVTCTYCDMVTATAESRID